MLTLIIRINDWIFLFPSYRHRLNVCNKQFYITGLLYTIVSPRQIILIFSDIEFRSAMMDLFLLIMFVL